MGLIPHARQGGRGVCAFAMEGSKLDGTGLEKLHIVHTQVAVLAGDESAGRARNGALSDLWSGDAVPLRDGAAPEVGARGCSEARFVGFGISVIFADDFMKPACERKTVLASSRGRRHAAGTRPSPYVELVALDLLQVERNRVPPRIGLVDVA